MNQYELPIAYQINQLRSSLRTLGLYLKQDAKEPGLFYITCDISNILFKQFRLHSYYADKRNNPNLPLSNWALRDLLLQHVIDSKKLMLFSELPILKDLRQQFQHASNVGVWGFIKMEELHDLCSATNTEKLSYITPMFFQDVSQVRMTHVVTANGQYRNEVSARLFINDHLPFCVACAACQIDPKIRANKL